MARKKPLKNPPVILRAPVTIEIRYEPTEHLGGQESGRVVDEATMLTFDGSHFDVSRRLREIASILAGTHPGHAADTGWVIIVGRRDPLRRSSK